MKCTKWLLGLVLLVMVGRISAQETSYSDDCVLATVASVAYNISDRGIQVKVDLIPKWAEKYNLDCLKNIVFNIGGFDILGLLGPRPTIGQIVCSVIGDLNIR